jgi:hypothetical protein
MSPGFGKVAWESHNDIRNETPRRVTIHDSFVFPSHHDLLADPEIFGPLRAITNPLLSTHTQVVCRTPSNRIIALFLIVGCHQVTSSSINFHHEKRKHHRLLCYVIIDAIVVIAKQCEWSIISTT